MTIHCLTRPQSTARSSVRTRSFTWLVLVMAALAASQLMADPTHVRLIDDPNEAVGSYFAAIDNHGQILGNGPSASRPNFLLYGNTYRPVALRLTGATCAGMNERNQIVGYYSGLNLFPSRFNHGFILDHGVVTTLDDPNAVSMGGTEAADINNKSQIVGGYVDRQGLGHGFLLQKGVYTNIDDPNAGSHGGTYATGINDKAQIVGSYQDANSVYHGFLLDKGVYNTLDAPGAAQTDLGGTYATGINNRGQIVGDYGDATGHHGFLLDAGAYTTLDDPNAAGFTLATGINDNGQIVGYYAGDSGFGYRGNHGFLLQEGIYMDAPPDAKARCDGQAVGISDLGQVVGTYTDADSIVHGFLTLGNLYITLDAPGAAGAALPGYPSGTHANGVNNLGQVVGTYFDIHDVAHGFFYDNGVYFALNDPNALQTKPRTGTYALGINDKRQIVGYYIDATGEHGFILDKGVYTTLSGPSEGAGPVQAIGINNRGQIVGDYDVFPPKTRGFLLDHGVYTTISPIIDDGEA